MNDERNIKIRLIRSEEVPESIRGNIMKLDGNDNYMMLINGAKSEGEQIASFLHECLHIWRRDLDQNDSVTMTEKEEHEVLRRILEEIQHS